MESLKLVHYYNQNEDKKIFFPYFYYPIFSYI